MNFSGQDTGSSQSGAFLSIGNRSGTGVATVTHGSQINLSNPGTSGASLNRGGTSTNPLGNGTLTVSGGSHINLARRHASGPRTGHLGVVVRGHRGGVGDCSPTNPSGLKARHRG